MGDRDSCCDLKAVPFLICINLCRISNRFLLCIHNLNLGGSIRADFTTSETGNSNSHEFFNERICIRMHSTETRIKMSSKDFRPLKNPVFGEHFPKEIESVTKTSQ